MASKAVDTDTMYEDLLKRFSETRKLNMKLLEEKRELLLRMQEETSSSPKQSDRPCSTCTGLFGSARRVSESGAYSEKEACSGIEMREFEESLSCSCRSTGKLRKLMELNQEWQKKYESLKREYAELKENCIKMDDETKEDREENERLKMLVGKLSSDLDKFGFKSSSPRCNYEAKDAYNINEIEALKHQLIAYKEDFDNERQDKEKLLNEKKRLEDQLKHTDNRLQSVSLENRKYRLCLSQVTQQKQHLISEMRRLSTSALPFSPVHEEEIPIDTRFSTYSCGQADVIPRSSPPSRPHIRKTSASAFMGAPAFEDSQCY